MRIPDATEPPPQIKHVPDGETRPHWSVMILTYNCAGFLRQTLQSVLAQDPGPELMQIEVIDDCSTRDDPEAVVREVGKGRIAFFRKQKNEGATAAFNTCIERSLGRLVHILHGDDWVEAGFYAQVGQCFNADSNLGICFARSFIVDEKGQLESLSPRMKTLENGGSSDAGFMLYGNPVRTPGVVVKRSVYERCGGFLPNLVHTADWEMWVRLIEKSKGVFLNIPLANYRNFSENDTGKLTRTGENMRDYLRLAEVFALNFPHFKRTDFKRMVLVTARHQTSRFRKLGDKTAQNANALLYRELFLQQPLKTQIKEAIIFIAKALRHT